eukprot:Lankesteria_metandrocarpae@DN8346_c0_g1_i1.p1
MYTSPLALGGDQSPSEPQSVAQAAVLQQTYHQYASLGARSPQHSTVVDSERTAAVGVPPFTQSSTGDHYSTSRLSSLSGDTTPAALRDALEKSTYLCDNSSSSNGSTDGILVTSSPQFQYSRLNRSNRSPTAAASVAVEQISPNNSSSKLTCSRCHRAECFCTELASTSGCTDSAVTPRQIPSPHSVAPLDVGVEPSPSAIVAVHRGNTHVKLPTVSLTVAAASAGSNTTNTCSMPHNYSSNSLYRKKELHRQRSPACSNHSMRSLTSNRQQQQLDSARRRRRRGSGDAWRARSSSKRDGRRHEEHQHLSAGYGAVVKLCLLAFMMTTTSGIFYGNNAAKELWRNAESLKEPPPTSPLLLTLQNASIFDALHRIEDTFGRHRDLQSMEDNTTAASSG